MTKTIDETAQEFDVYNEFFIVAGYTDDAKPAVRYQGNIRELRELWRLIRDTLRDREGIGNSPNRNKPPQE